MTPQSEQAHFAVGQGSHVGLVRENNEDAFGWFSVPAGELFVIADGMGGCAGGEEAARLAVTTVNNILSTCAGTPENLLREAVRAADAAVLDAAKADPHLQDMGSTLVTLLLKGRDAFYTHVGDSRLYVLTDGILRQLTRDHSHVQGLLDNGEISPDEAAHHPERNIITQCLGGNVSESRLVVEHRPCGSEDIFLLCTDGLSGLVSDEEIRRILLLPQSPQVRAQRLLEMALQAGGTDNVTVQVVAFGSGAQRHVADHVAPQYTSGRQLGRLLSAFAAGVLMGIGGLYTWQTWLAPLLAVSPPPVP